MKKFGIKSVVAAVGALAAVCAQAAAVNLDTGTVSVKYANEVITTSAVNLKGDGLLTNADLKVANTLGASFGAGAVAYVRYDLTNATFTVAPTAGQVVVTGALPPGDYVVSVAQVTSSYVIFALGTLNATDSLLLTDSLTFDLHPSGLSTANKNGVQMRYQLFETLTAAVNQTPLTSLKNVNKTIAEFAPTITATIDTLGERVSDVAASPSFTAFTTGATGTDTLPFAKYKVAVGTTFNPLSAVGAPVTAGSILAATNAITVTGGFSYLTGTGATTAARVYLDEADTAVCDANLNVATSTATSGSVSFTGITAANITNTNGWYLCADAQIGGVKPEILPTQYTANVNLVEQTGFAVADASGASGSIITNGATLIAPLTNQPDGWMSRLVLVNSGAQPRDYQITYITETGTTAVGTGAALNGTIPANTTVVIPLQDPNVPAMLTTITGGPKRTSVKAVVKAPLTEITGSYQIVNPSGSSISNQTMVAK